MTDVIALRARMLRSWREWIGRVVGAVKELLPDAEVYVIGSVAEGSAVGSSDLDLLVVSRAAPSRPREVAELKALIEEKAGLPLYHPLELHLVRPEEAERYLRRCRRPIKLAGSDEGPPPPAARPGGR